MGYRCPSFSRERGGKNEEQGLGFVDGSWWKKGNMESGGGREEGGRREGCGENGVS